MFWAISASTAPLDSEWASEPPLSSEGEGAEAQNTVPFYMLPAGAAPLPLQASGESKVQRGSHQLIGGYLVPTPTKSQPWLGGTTASLLAGLGPMWVSCCNPRGFLPLPKKAPKHPLRTEPPPSSWVSHPWVAFF